MKLVCPGEAINHCALSANSPSLHLYTSNISSLISSYFAVKGLISVKTASGAPSVRKFGYLVSIQEILDLTKSSVHTSTHSCKPG